MALHIQTLLVVAVFIFCLMGLLTFHAWCRETRERPLAYLCGMMLLAAVGVVLVSDCQSNASAGVHQWLCCCATWTILST